MVLALALAGAAAQAQIRVGQTVGLTGPVAATVAETRQGALLWIDAVNAQGGVNGQKIELQTLDDQFDVQRTVDNAKQLIDSGVIALFLTRGTPHNQALLPLLSASRIPLIGPSTGAMVLHKPVQPWVFNVRAAYQREAERAVAHLVNTGITRVALVQVNDSFGDDAVQGALKALKTAGLSPAAHERYDRSKPDFSQLTPAVVNAQAQAVLYVGSGTAVVDGMKALRAAGSRAQLVTLSNNASDGFIKQLGDVARGTIVSQVFPSERSISTPMIKDVLALAKAKGIQNVSPAMVEGFAAAKVLVEGLRRAGRNPDRASLVQALERMQRVDLGGLDVSFSAQDHSGLDYADLAIIGPDGRFQR
ncbi:MAG: amino acid ABC transporter substrate-binding protein [Burkholderiales bacterium PBB6]|nr:MAG: amino acid ABC transporter substrate-binding protein [Burkholderiales bacterium PBB6]